MARDRNALEHFFDDESARLKGMLEPHQLEQSLRELVLPGTVMAMDGRVAFAFQPPGHIQSLDDSNLDEPDYQEALKIWLNNYFPPAEVTIRNYRRDGAVGVMLTGASAQRFTDIMANKKAVMPDYRALVDEVSDEAHTAAAIIDRAKKQELFPSGDVGVTFSIPRKHAQEFMNGLRDRYGPRITLQSPPKAEGDAPMVTMGTILHGPAAEKFLHDARQYGKL